MTVTELSTMLNSKGMKDEDLREMEIELNKKLTIPLACLLFALIGLPLGIRAHRSVRSRGFAIGLAVVLIYYLLRLSGEALVETGRLSPIIGSWAPSVIFAVTGLLLFYKAKRSPWKRNLREQLTRALLEGRSRIPFHSHLDPKKADRRQRGHHEDPGSLSDL